jgi:hypothetical protein
MFDVTNEGDADKLDGMRSMMAVSIDQGIRGAIHSLWMALPTERRNVDEVERQIRRLVDRAIQNLREDATEFGLPGGQTVTSE